MPEDEVDHNLGQDCGPCQGTGTTGTQICVTRAMEDLPNGKQRVVETQATQPCAMPRRFPVGSSIELERTRDGTIFVINGSARERLEECYPPPAPDPSGTELAAFAGGRRYIGMAPAQKSAMGTSFMNNWHPVSGYTETLCGQLTQHSVYEGAERDERDQCLFVAPDTAHEYLYDAMPVASDAGDSINSALADAGALWHEIGGYVASGGGDEVTWNDNAWPTCAGALPCIEAEVTAGAELKAWPQLGQRVCVHGPWVQEMAHGWKPEIHPAELLWWKTEHGAPGQCSLQEHWFAQLGDASARFDYAGRFDRDPGEGYVAPWASPPLRHTVALPFTVPLTNDGSLRDGKVMFALEQVQASGIETGTAFEADSKGEKVHLLTLRRGAGGPPLTLVEAQEAGAGLDLRHYGVWFSQVCRDTAAGTIRGKVEIQTGLGQAKGYNLFRVSQSLDRLAPRKVEPVAPSPPRLALAPGLSSCTVDGMSSKLCGTFTARLFSSPFQQDGYWARGRFHRVTSYLRQPRHFYALLGDRTVLTPDVRVVSRGGGPAGPGQPEAPAGGAQGSRDEAVFSLPLSLIGTLRLVDLDRNEVVGAFQLNGTALHLAMQTTPTLVQGSALAQIPGARGASFVRRTQGIAPGLSAGDLAHVSAWAVRAVPEYGGTKGNFDRAPEEDSALSARLNALLYGPQSDARRRVFGDNPVTIEWSLKVVEDGTVVATTPLVRTSARGPWGSVELRQTRFADDTLVLTAPATRQPLLQVIATARIRDSLGYAVTKTVQLWNTGVARDKAAAVVKAMGMRHGASRTVVDLVFAEPVGAAAPEPRVPVSRSNLALLRAVRLGAHRAGRDGVMTLGELRALDGTMTRMQARPAPQ